MPSESSTATALAPRPSMEYGPGSATAPLAPSMAAASGMTRGLRAAAPGAAAGASDIEEHGLAVAPQPDVEPEPAGLGDRDQRVPAPGLDRGQHRVGGVGRLLVGEVDP